MIIDTGGLRPDTPLPPGDQHQIYNGLDCCLTHEIHGVLPRSNSAALIYNFERAMQAPALEMMLRGLRVDLLSRDALAEHLRGHLTRLGNLLEDFGNAIYDRPINPRSPQQLKNIFYDVMRLPEQYQRARGKSTLSTNREALEKLEDYFYARPVVRTILAYRDLAKQLEFILTAVDPDGRIRTSYNIAGTETGRWSSSSNAFGTGGNLQNYPDKLRSIFVADEGRKLAYLDLSQAESWIVALRILALFGDSSYLDAIRSGDLHTSVCRMVWPDRPWTGDIKKDRELAEQKFYRDYDYRDMAKRGGHGTNYYGKPFTMAKHLKVTSGLMEEFQDAYFSAFPGIPKWHGWVSRQLGLNSSLVSLLGRERHFFGRPDDDTTLREAIAFDPQSSVGDLLNLGAYRIWRAGPSIGVRLLAQLHDAVLIDYPDEPKREAEYVAAASELLKVGLKVNGATYIIPTDAATGWNWGKFNDDPKRGRINRSGVAKFKGLDNRSRPSMRGLDRVIPVFH